MLQTQHKSKTYNPPFFSEHNAREEDISYRIFGVRDLPRQSGSVRIITPRVVRVEDQMEGLDHWRNPLALMRLRGESMTATQEAQLRALDELVGWFVERPTPMPPIVRDALARAERLLKK